eukprot:CAMPEP_0173165494 /NCGR_PEP_ID=MMETSP1105-20130129/21425_1 /TAXON_ID=2985 /ORGANISM="Ochromonas sp., Strain BG-1" /LENGTH=782 /DNA_ID=CAMNT_0014086503 /DNA_START=224 /DNA_END=2572 /DNA_ORIENTATION=+
MTFPPAGLPFYSDLFHQMSRVVGNGVAGYNGDNLPAGASLIYRPSSVWVSSSGSIYFSDRDLCLIRKISDSGIVSVIGGNRTCQRGPSSGHFRSLPLQFPYALVGDRSGQSLYIGDSNVLWRLNISTGFAAVIAGNMTEAAADGTEGSVTSVRFTYIQGLWLNSADSLYITDAGNFRIRVLDLTSMTVKTVAGNGTRAFHGDNGPATLACISSAFGIWENTEGNIFFADRDNYRIRRISWQGKITTIAGNGILGYVEDAVAATSTRLNSPRGVVGDSLGNIYIGEYLSRIRLLVPKASNSSSETLYTIYTIAGNGQCCGGNDVAPAMGPIGSILGLWLTTDYHLYLAEAESRVRVISPRFSTTSPPTAQPTFTDFCLAPQLFRELRLVVGNGTFGYNGNNLPAGTSTLVQLPTGLWISSKGDLYFSEDKNCLVRKIDALTGLVSIIGGSPRNCVADKNQEQAPFSLVSLNLPFGIAGDTNGKNLYVADVNRIFRVDLTTMNATLMAGNSRIQGFNGDNHSPAKNAIFRGIRNIWLNTNGILFIADQPNHRVRAIDVVEETVVTIAGNGTMGFFGDSLDARNAMFRNPWDIFQDSAGLLFICDLNNNRIRRVSVDGIITTIAGTDHLTYNGDQIPATMASLSYPHSVRGDSTGILYVADSYSYRIRSLQPVSRVGTNVEYIIDTLAGTGTLGSSVLGTGIMDQINPPPPMISVSYVYGMWLTTDSRLYLSEGAKIRVLMPSFDFEKFQMPTEVPDLPSLETSAGADVGAIEGETEQSLVEPAE